MKSPKKILLVDDEEANLFIAQRKLKNLAVEAEVLIAKHGKEALNIVK